MHHRHSSFYKVHFFLLSKPRRTQREMSTVLDAVSTRSLTASTFVQAPTIAGTQVQLQAFASFASITAAYPVPASAKGLVVLCDNPSGLFFCDGIQWAPIDKSVYDASMVGSSAVAINETAGSGTYQVIGAFTAGLNYTKRLSLDAVNGRITADTTDDIGDYIVTVSAEGRFTSATGTNSAGTLFLAVGNWGGTINTPVAALSFPAAPVQNQTGTLVGSAKITLAGTTTNDSLCMLMAYAGDATPSTTFTLNNYTITARRVY